MPNEYLLLNIMISFLLPYRDVHNVIVRGPILFNFNNFLKLQEVYVTPPGPPPYVDLVGGAKEWKKEEGR